MLDLWRTADSEGPSQRRRIIQRLALRAWRIRQARAPNTSCCIFSRTTRQPREVPVFQHGIIIAHQVFEREKTVSGLDTHTRRRIQPYCRSRQVHSHASGNEQNLPGSIGKRLQAKAPVLYFEEASDSACDVRLGNEVFVKLGLQTPVIVRKQLLLLGGLDAAAASPRTSIPPGAYKVRRRYQ